MTIASLIVEIGANTVKLQKDVEGVNGTLNKVGTFAKTAGAMIAGAFTIDTIVNAGMKVVDFAGHLTDLSGKTKLSTTFLQKLDLAFSPFGISVDAAADAANKLAGNIVGGDKSTVAALTKLGIPIADLKKMKPEDQFLTVADAVGKLQDQGERVYASKTLFGKGGVELLAGLDGGLTQTTKKFEDMGVIIDEETIAAADDFGDQLGMMGKQLMALLASVLAPLLPVLTLFGDYLLWIGQKIIGPILTFALQNLIVTGLKLEAWWLNFLSTLAEAAQRIPIVGKHLGFMGDAADFLREKSAKMRDMAASMGDHTVKAGEAAAGASPKLVGLGKDAAAAGDAAGKAAQKMTQLQDSLTGEDTRRKVRELGAAWSDLQRQHRDDEFSTRQLLQQYDALRGQMRPSELPADLEALRTKFFNLTAEYEKNAGSVHELEAGTEGLTRALTALGAAKPPDLHALSPGQIPTSPLSGTIDALPRATLDSQTPFSFAQQLFSGVRDAFSNLPAVIVGALQGGGDALKAAGSYVGGILGTNAASMATQSIAKHFTSEVAGKSVTSGLGKMLSSAAGAVLPVVGTLLGPLISGVGKLFGKLFGPSDAEKTAKERDKWVKSLAEAGTNIQELSRRASVAGYDMDKLMSTRRVKDFQAQLTELDKALQFQDDAMATLDATVQKYNISAANQGPVLALRQTQAEAKELYQDWMVLKAGQLDVAVIADSMAGRINDFVASAKRAGAEIPVEWRGILQTLIDNGKLVDETGRKYENLDETGLTFAAGFQTVVDSIKSLTDAILRGLGLLPGAAQRSADGINRSFATVRPPPFIDDVGAGGVDSDLYTLADDGTLVPRFATGGLVGRGRVQYFAAGFMPRGADTIPAMLSPGEMVINPNQQRAIGSLLRRGQGGGNVIDLAEVRALRAEMKKTREANERLARYMAQEFATDNARAMRDELQKLTAVRR